MTINGRLPQQADCDPTKPDEHFLWALSQIPYGDKVMQPIQPNIARTISQHLHELGFRHHPQLQTRKLQVPHRGQQHYLNGLSRWVPMDTEEPEPVTLPDPAGMTTHERQLMVDELKNVGAIQDPPPNRGKLAEVTHARKFDSPHVRSARNLQGGVDDSA